MSDETRYIASVNGNTVGMFSSPVEAETQALQALARGFNGPHVMNAVRLIEVRDSKNSYQIVCSRRV